MAHPYISHMWPYPYPPVTYGWNLYLPTEPYDSFLIRSKWSVLLMHAELVKNLLLFYLVSLRKQPTFGDATTHFPAK